MNAPLTSTLKTGYSPKAAEGTWNVSAALGLILVSRLTKAALFDLAGFRVAVKLLGI